MQVLREYHHNKAMLSKNTTPVIENFPSKVRPSGYVNAPRSHKSEWEKESCKVVNY